MIRKLTRLEEQAACSVCLQRESNDLMHANAFPLGCDICRADIVRLVDIGDPKPHPAPPMENEEEIRTIYKDLSEAAFYLPIQRGVAELSVERFERALHRLHVLVSNVPSEAALPPSHAGETDNA